MLIAKEVSRTSGEKYDFRFLLTNLKSSSISLMLNGLLFSQLYMRHSTWVYVGTRGRLLSSLVLNQPDAFVLERTPPDVKYLEAVLVEQSVDAPSHVVTLMLLFRSDR